MKQLFELWTFNSHHVGEREKGIGVLVVATGILFGISVVGLPSSLGFIAALLLALATLVVGTSNEGRSV